MGRPPVLAHGFKNAVTAACRAALDPNSEPDATALIGMI